VVTYIPSDEETTRGTYVMFSSVGQIRLSNRHLSSQHSVRNFGCSSVGRSNMYFAPLDNQEMSDTVNIHGCTYPTSRTMK
jgi:Uri superfamily endonuclease